MSPRTCFAVGGSPSTRFSTSAAEVRGCPGAGVGTRVAQAGMSTVDPSVPLVGLFETAFYQFAPEPMMRYAVPDSWHDIGVRRWGFHGASHKFIAERSAELLGRKDIARRAANLYVDGGKSPVGGAPLRVISCHLGGSSSITGIFNGVAIGNSLGMSPQSGLPHNNRVGDFDPFAIPVIMKATGLSLDEVLHQLAEKSGLLGLSGVSGDIRDLEEAAAAGNARARLALDVFAAEIRRHLGGVLAELGGADVIVFTGGIGENALHVRSAVLGNLQGLGIELDPQANASAKGECCVSKPGSRTQIWIVPTNEELVVARQTVELLSKKT